MKRLRVLVACEFSGIVRDAFIAKGHDAISCDLLPTERPGPHIQGDVLEILDDGWNVRDDNFLQCSDTHIYKVFAMLRQQKELPVFSGGLEAKLLKSWHVEELRQAKTQRMYFAYDQKKEYEYLEQASKILFNGGFKPHDRKCCCYCLCGYRGDTLEKAEKRFWQIIDLGMTPFAMLYRDIDGFTEKAWNVFQRLWASPIIIYSRFPQGKRA